jgi:hypothetical protein
MALESMAAQFSGLPMEDLIGGPLKAACDAQTLLAKATSQFIHEVGFEPGTSQPATPGQPAPVGSYKARTVDFSFTRPVQQGPDGDVKQEKVELKVPMLAIVNVPALSVKEVDINFTMEVKSSESHHDSSDTKATMDATAKMGWGPFSATVKIHGSVASHSENTRSSDNSAKYDVKVLARDDGMPEGLRRVMDLLNTAVAPAAKPAVK